MPQTSTTLKYEQIGKGLKQAESEHLIKRLYDDYTTGNWSMGTPLTPQAAVDKIRDQLETLNSYDAFGLCEKLFGLQPQSRAGKE